ncbi:DEAD/DEAH box helicase [Rhodohalobacter sp. SW132]|uniref:DEAD/DEAH box helicase n=1 Tax=Rhodohalobacter sp. SW132 TaxID=2293433 RepID=UPI000E2825ED|nr:DEAD/DEAH box helicase [Rhodohalobacter sp. SW132]REL37638.1 DEAD/DEAH box helicase [Rhodohalobacter sp. SW132]
MKFTDFNLSDELIAGLNDLQFNEPTPVQEQAIPIVTEGRDLIAAAQTGTGKTGAFVIPIMERVLKSNREGIKALILSPTRELASQIDEQIFAIGYHAGISSATVIGGSDFSQQAKALKAGVDIIVATPGRLIDQNKVLGIDFSKLEYFVLDEADRMLDMGFLPDMKKIISWLPEKRQTLLFSATMPKEIQKLAGSIMENPALVEIERSKPSQSVEQRAYKLRSKQKVSLVKKIFDDLQWDSCIIFTSTKKGTDELQRLLKREGIKAASIHGDRSQDERNKALQAFKNGQVPVIVATDVLARGIDIKEVSIIINYDVPNNTDDYVHRIGRTGRYDKSGIAITFVSKRDSRVFSQIENIKGNKIKTIDLPSNFNEKSEFSWDSDLKQAKKSGGDRSRSKDDSDREKRNQQSKKSRSTESSDTDTDKDKSRDSGKKSDSRQKRNGKPTQKTEQSEQSSPKNKQTDSDQKSKGRSEKNKTKSEGRSGGRTNGSGRSSKKQDDKVNTEAAAHEKKIAELEKVAIPPAIEKAAERNKNSLKPAKGFWGIVKSFLPKF